MTDLLLVITNMPDAASAQSLALRIIEERAAACVNQLAPCVSVYRWQEQVETAQEIPLLIKTTRSDYARLENLIRACHPYSCPEIIALPVTAALPDYLHWARQQTQITKE